MSNNRCQKSFYPSAWFFGTLGYACGCLILCFVARFWGFARHLAVIRKSCRSPFPSRRIKRNKLQSSGPFSTSHRFPPIYVENVAIAMYWPSMMHVSRLTKTGCQPAPWLFCTGPLPATWLSMQVILPCKMRCNDSSFACFVLQNVGFVHTSGLAFKSRNQDRGMMST